jgi:16S rRNA (uracil1498-N3)-methyltransferase
VKPLQRLVCDGNWLPDQPIDLTPEQRHYLVRVLRLAIGDRFIVLNGQGQSWIAQLTDPNSSDPNATGSDATCLEVLAPDLTSSPRVRLLLALPKQGFDEVVRQATELGVSEIQPVLSQRTILKPSDNKLDRWQRIAQEAAEQSERLWVPQVQAPLDLKTALTQFGSPVGPSYICTARGNPPSLARRLVADRLGDTPLTIAIGPEGGWTPDEVELAQGLGYQAVSLGTGILRAVTAPLAVLAIVATVIDLIDQPGTEGSGLPFTEEC